MARMNAPDKLAQLLSLTREPFPASHKVYASGQLHPQLRVPMRDVHLSNGEIATLYDTSGPYTDPSAEIDVRRGLPALRNVWIEARRGVRCSAADSARRAAMRSASRSS